MEFTHSGWLAIFTGTDTLMGRSREVDAWDSITGTAMIVDAEQGARRPVTDYPDFSHLERANRVVGVVPGAGWRACARGHMANDPDSPAEPVLAWLVSSRGVLTPVTMDADGEIGLDDTMSRYFPPGSELD
ncbi:hypothetical protein [Nocardia asteroides]|uniref:hypothetical protein n=1 Tax=Nocardia asteroides TaxID=1824 RepID=UPI001E51BCC2|nr:hypothetical protein [Nocardia asteroides]UGT62574.1 hypothetical protein LTT61_04295 [Nocardia asteroides]